jgi:hypothetical protein
LTDCCLVADLSGKEELSFDIKQIRKGLEIRTQPNCVVHAYHLRHPRARPPGQLFRNFNTKRARWIIIQSWLFRHPASLPGILEKHLSNHCNSFTYKQARPQTEPVKYLCAEYRPKKTGRKRTIQVLPAKPYHVTRKTYLNLPILIKLVICICLVHYLFPYCSHNRTNVKLI